MSHLFGSRPKVIPEFTGLQVNTSVQVLPIPILYGSPRVAINLIYYNGFFFILKKSGGKGLLSGGKGAKQAEYFASFAAAIGEGTLGDIKIIYQDQSVYTLGTFPSNGMSYFNGTPTQPPWPFVVSLWPVDARTYKDTAYLAFANAQLDSSATVPQLNIVVAGLFAGSSPLNNSTIKISTGQYNSSGQPISFIGDIPLGDADADPAQVIYDFLTNERYGATFPAEFIDTSTLFTLANGWDPSIGDTTLSTFCQAVGLAWSVALENVESANSVLDRWCKNLNTAIVWNGSILRFIPYWDSPSDTNPGWDPMNGIPKKYFTPYTTPIVSIPMDQILQSDQKDEDPITWSRKDPLEVYNTVRIDFRDRNNFFNDVPVEAKDEVHAELYGPRIDNIGLAKEFTLSSYANIAATMLLRRNISIMRNFTWRMSALWGWLDPMDIVIIPDPADYTRTVQVRIVSVEDDADEIVTIGAEEFPVGDQAPTVMPVSETTAPNQGATNSPSSPVYPPVIFAPPTDMLTATGFATPQVIIGASAGFNGTLDTNYGGSFIWTSLDNVNYQELGEIVGPSAIGSLSTALPGYGGVNPDTGDTLRVNLNECDGLLTSVSDAAAAAGSSICCIQDASGFEILSYTTATLVGPFTWDLTGLYRGLYGTTPRFFGAGSKFLYVGTGANVFETNLPAAYIGMTFWVKLQTFNVFNQAVEDLADVVAYEYVATGPTPVPPIPPPMISPTARRIPPRGLISSMVRKKPR